TVFQLKGFQLKRDAFHNTICLRATFHMNHQHDDRDAHVIRLYEQLGEIEQRLIPTGLHVLGRPSELSEKADLLRMVASFDRPELGVRSLTSLVAEAQGIEGYDKLLQDIAASETRELIDGIVAEAVRQFCLAG